MLKGSQSSSMSLSLQTSSEIPTTVSLNYFKSTLPYPFYKHAWPVKHSPIFFHFALTKAGGVISATWWHHFVDRALSPREGSVLLS